MKQINVKNEYAAELLDKVVIQTGQGKTEAVTTALELYLQSLTAKKRAEAAIELAKRIHELLPEAVLGQAPSKEEQEKLLGM